MRATAAITIAVVILGCSSAAPRVSSATLGAEAEPGDDERDQSAQGLERFEGREHDSADGLERFDRRDGAPGTDDSLDHFDRREHGSDQGLEAGGDARRGEPPVGPRVAEVLTAAYAAAGLAGRLPGQIAVRARLGGLVPWVSVRTGRDASWHDEDPDVGRGTTLEVRATWRLDRLVFDGRELQVVALEAARRRERRRLATHVIRTYFAWKRSRSRSRSEEAAAELDALTSGWFSEAKRRAASEVRTAPEPTATP